MNKFVGFVWLNVLHYYATTTPLGATTTIPAALSRSREWSKGISMKFIPNPSFLVYDF